MTTTRLGTLMLPFEHWSDARASWQRAEEMGLDIAYTADHLTHPTAAGRWWADGWTTLAAAAQVTTRLEVGTLVASAAVRGPAVLARTAATLADLSGGRFVLGLGAGTPGDAVANGDPEPTAAHLSRRFGSTVGTLSALWSGSEDSGAGALGVVVEPLPTGASAPHLLLAAHGPRAYALVARYADGWSTYGGPAAAGLGGTDLWDLLAVQGEQVTSACEALGRDPSTLRRSVLLGYGPDRPLASVGAFVDVVGAATERGFDEVVIYWPTGAPGDRFWADPDVLAEGVAAVRRG